MAERINFTKTALENLIDQHEGERLVVYDTKQAGLIAELREGGTLSFYVFRRQRGGPPKRIRIGPYPEVTIEGARDQAKVIVVELVKGNDPNLSRRAKRQEATLKDLFTHWLETHAKLHKRTWEEDERQFNTLLVGWHTRRLSAVNRNDVRALHARIGKDNGPYAANRLLALIRAMFNKAGDVGFDGANPTKGVKKFKEQSRDRFLQPDEMTSFFAAVDAEPDATLRDFFKMCLYTGARKMNVCAMRWEDINFPAATWRIPDTKSGEPVTIHLPSPAVELLKARLETRENGYPWVFPGGKKNRASHLSSPKDAWKRLVDRGGFKDLRLHDLRRTLGSFQAAAGASMAIIGKSLGHKAGSPATAVYARMNLDPVRASVDIAVQAIVAAAMKGGENGKS